LGDGFFCEAKTMSKTNGWAIEGPDQDGNFQISNDETRDSGLGGLVVSQADAIDLMVSMLGAPILLEAAVEKIGLDGRHNVIRVLMGLPRRATTLSALPPVLEGPTGPSLEQGQPCTLTRPYELQDDMDDMKFRFPAIDLPLLSTTTPRRTP